MDFASSLQKYFSIQTVCDIQLKVIGYTSRLHWTNKTALLCCRFLHNETGCLLQIHAETSDTNFLWSEQYFRVSPYICRNRIENAGSKIQDFRSTRSLLLSFVKILVSSRFSAISTRHAFSNFIKLLRFFSFVYYNCTPFCLSVQPESTGKTKSVFRRSLYSCVHYLYCSDPELSSNSDRYSDLCSCCAVLCIFRIFHSSFCVFLLYLNTTLLQMPAFSCMIDCSMFFFSFFSSYSAIWSVRYRQCCILLQPDLILSLSVRF